MTADSDNKYESCGCINTEQHLQKCWGFPSDSFWKCYCCGQFAADPSSTIDENSIRICGCCNVVSREERSALLAKRKQYDPYAPSAAVPATLFKPEIDLPKGAIFVEPELD